MTTLRELFRPFRVHKELTVKGTTLGIIDDKLQPFIRWAEAQDPPITCTNLHEDHIDKYLSHESKRGCNPGGVNIIARNIKTFVLFGHERGHIAHKLKVTLPEVPEYESEGLKPEEIVRLFAAIKTGWTRMVERDRFLLSLFLDCGGRRFSIAALDWGDFGWDNEYNIGTVRLIEKGNKPDTQSFYTRETLERMKVYREWCQGKGIPTGSNDPVFVSSQNWRLDPETGRAERDPKTGRIVRYPLQRITKQGLHLWIVRLSERTAGEDWWEEGSNGLPPVDVRLHRLRHTAGRRCANELGMPIRTVQKMLGHRNVKTTERYTTPTAEDVARAFAKAHNDRGSEDQPVDQSEHEPEEELEPA